MIDANDNARASWKSRNIIMMDVNTRTRGSGSLLDLVTPIAAASALACLTLALATPNWYLHHHHPHHHYPHHHYLPAKPNWYLHYPTSIHSSSPPPVRTPPLPIPWDTKGHNWDHPWEYPLKMYLLDSSSAWTVSWPHNPARWALPAESRIWTSIRKFMCVKKKYRHQVSRIENESTIQFFFILTPWK